MLIDKIPKNIFDVSSRTRALIVVRIGKGCSNCGWNEASCDIHHIVSTKHGGTNEHVNLTVLCPNCHRLAHSGKLADFISFDVQIGDSWLLHYSSDRSRLNPNGRKGKTKSMTPQR